MDISASRLLSQCPLCRATYADVDIQRLVQRGPATWFHCTCRACRHALVAVVLESSGWVSSVGMVTDLMAEEVIRLSAREPISSDECIKTHVWLRRKTKQNLLAYLTGKES